VTKIVRGLAEEPTRYIVGRLRQIDRKEIFATREDTDEEHLLFDLMYVAEKPGLHFTAFAGDGEPVAVFGYSRLREGVATLFAFGTDRWKEVVLSMTKVILRVIFPTLTDEGYHRADCAALKERADTAKWLPFLGLSCEAVLAGFGSQREDFSLYVWRPERVLQEG
jgi:hypothetical protein